MQKYRPIIALEGTSSVLQSAADKRQGVELSTGKSFISVGFETAGH